MRAVLVALALVFLIGCSFGVRIDLARRASAAPDPAPTAVADRRPGASVASLVGAYITAIDEPCEAGSLPAEFCAEQYQRLIALQHAQLEEQQAALRALSLRAGQVAHEPTRHRLLAILGRVGQALLR